MNDKMQKLMENIMPFLMLGIGIALFIGLLFMFFYIAVWGIIIGGILWVAALIKQYLFPGKPVIKKEEGRIIEHDDNNK